MIVQIVHHNLPFLLADHLAKVSVSFFNVILMLLYNINFSDAQFFVSEYCLVRKCHVLGSVGFDF